MLKVEKEGHTSNEFISFDSPINKKQYSDTKCEDMPKLQFDIVLKQI